MILEWLCTIVTIVDDDYNSHYRTIGDCGLLWAIEVILTHLLVLSKQHNYWNLRSFPPHLIVTTGRFSLRPNSQLTTPTSLGFEKPHQMGPNNSDFRNYLKNKVALYQNYHSRIIVTISPCHIIMIPSVFFFVIVDRYLYVDPRTSCKDEFGCPSIELIQRKETGSIHLFFPLLHDSPNP